MKKILFMMLSLAVATSAIAGGQLNVQKVKYQSTKKAEKVSPAPVLSYNKNVQSMNVNAPRVTAQQRAAMTCEGLKLLENMSKPASFKAPVTSQPAGEVKNYLRSGMAIYQASESGVYQGEQSGVVTVVVDGDTYWFKNLLYDPNNKFPEYWIQGTKSGDKINIDLPQDIDDQTYSSYGLTIQMVWGATRLSGQNISFTPNTNADASFTVNADGTLTLDNATYSGNWVGNGLNAYMTFYGETYYQGASIFTTTLTPADNIPETPVMYDDEYVESLTGTEVAYYRTGYSWVITDDNYLDIAEQDGYGYVFYDADGETVYLRNPLYDMNSGYWIKGTKEGDVLTFPLDQYIYWDTKFRGLRTTWGTFTLDTVSGDISFEKDVEATTMTFTIGEDGSLTMNNCGIADEDYTVFVGLGLILDTAYVDKGFYGPLDFFTKFYTIPGTPTEVNVTPAATTAQVAWTDETSNMWNVRYRQYNPDVYFNDFETEAVIAPIWGFDGDGDGYWWDVMRLSDGNIIMYSESYHNATYEALTPDNWMITPEVTLDGVIRFDAWGVDPSYAAENFKVYIFVGDTAGMTDPASQFIAVSEDQVTTGDVTTFNYNIPEEYQGQKGYVAIRHYNVTDQFILAIDNLYVGDPNYTTPEWNNIENVEELQALLEGLTPDTDYEVQVQGVNAGGVGMWTNSVYFHTLADQPTVVRGDATGEGDVNMDDLSALINFLLGGDPDAINYDNVAICDALTGDESEVVTMDDLSSLINFLLNGSWPN